MPSPALIRGSARLPSGSPGLLSSFSPCPSPTCDPGGSAGSCGVTGGYSQSRPEGWERPQGVKCWRALSLFRTGHPSSPQVPPSLLEAAQQPRAHLCVPLCDAYTLQIWGLHVPWSPEAPPTLGSHSFPSPLPALRSILSTSCQGTFPEMLFPEMRCFSPLP